MDVSALTKLLSDSPLAAICALLVLAVVALFVALIKSYRDKAAEIKEAHKREMELSMRVVVLTEKLAPAIVRMVETKRRKRGDTGAHTVVREETP